MLKPFIDRDSVTFSLEKLKIALLRFWVGCCYLGEKMCHFIQTVRIPSKPRGDFSKTRLLLNKRERLRCSISPGHIPVSENYPVETQSYQRWPGFWRQLENTLQEGQTLSHYTTLVQLVKAHTYWLAPFRATDEIETTFVHLPYLKLRLNGGSLSLTKSDFT